MTDTSNQSPPSETNYGTCENHPHHTCRCTDEDRQRARDIDAAVAAPPSELVISKPLCRCTACLADGVEVVDWRYLRSDGRFSAWECSRCGHRTVLLTYYDAAIPNAATEQRGETS